MSVKEKENTIEKEIEKEVKIDKKIEKKIQKEATKKVEEHNNLAETSNSDFVPITEPETKSVTSIFTLLLGIVVIILLLAFLIFTGYNLINQNIVSGVHIKGLDVSNLSKSDARYQLENYIEENLPEEIKLKHGDFETTISLSQIGAEFDTKAAVNTAYNVGRQGNIFQNNLYVLNTMFGKTNIEPTLNLDTEQLTKNLEDISAQLPDKVVESSYYIEGNNLIITSGKEGNVVDIEPTIEAIKSAICNFSEISNPSGCTKCNLAPIAAQVLAIFPVFCGISGSTITIFIFIFVPPFETKGTEEKCLINCVEKC